MGREDLLFVDYKISNLLVIACDSVTCHREFQCETEVDGCVDDSVEAEDFLLAVGILRIVTNADSCVHIGGQLGTAKEERTGSYAAAQNDAGNQSSFDGEIETCSLNLFLQAEDLFEDAGLVRVGFLKAKGGDLYPGHWDMGGESRRRAVCLDPDLLAEDDPGRIDKTIKNPWQFGQEKTDRVICEADEAVSESHYGTNKGEIYQGSDESGKLADDPSIRVDFHVATLVGVLR
jgi:hypothetical protein